MLGDEIIIGFYISVAMGHNNTRELLIVYQKLYLNSLYCFHFLCLLALYN